MLPAILISKTIYAQNSTWVLWIMMTSTLAFIYLIIGKKLISFYPFFIIWERKWKEKHLTKAYRAVLIQAILQAIPVHVMSCLKIPKLICSQIESYIRRFFWGGSPDHKKIHWIDWNILCTRKLDCGLGFRNMCFFNQALLAKQGWKIASQTDSLLHKIFKAIFSLEFHSSKLHWVKILPITGEV